MVKCRRLTKLKFVSRELGPEMSPFNTRLWSLGRFRSNFQRGIIDSLAI